MTQVILNQLGFRSPAEVRLALVKSEVEADRKQNATTHNEIQGTLRDKYNIYIDCLSDGEKPKTYDQWLNS